MSAIDPAHFAEVAQAMRERAARGTFDGKPSSVGSYYFDRCRRDDHATATRLLFTRDVGHHTGGWWKNPDYERCWHLSMSPMPARIILPGIQRAELDRPTRQAWLSAFFGEHERLLWAEPPYSEVGKRVGVWHWRLFADENWQPILPRGEVYSRDFTERGWLSWSEVCATETAEHEGVPT